MVKSDDPQPVFIPPHSGKKLDFLPVTHKLTSEQTSGAYYMFESEFEPGARNRLHVHRREDEIGYVLEGSLEILLPDQTRILGAGGIARLPKNIPHAIRNPLEIPSRYLFITLPGGLDEWFDAVADANRDGVLTDELFSKLSQDFGIGWLE
jgi:quercetin dioxygenase-like cupin family protein